jgi:hypothetical protein
MSIHIVNTLLLLIFSVLIRALFLFKLETASSDNYAHRWMIAERVLFKNLRQNPMSRSLIHGYRGYPPFSHWLLARFFPDNYTVAGRILNIAYDSVIVGMVYAVIVTILGQEASMTAFAMALVYSTTPLLLPAQPRMLAMGARTFGCLLYNVFFLFYAGYHCSGHMAWLIPCSMITLVIILSSQFAMQALFWSCLFLSVWLGTFAPAAAMVGGILLSLLPCFDGGRLFYRKLKHIAWYVEYLRKSKKETSGVAARNRFRTTIAPLRNILRTPFAAMSGFLSNNSLVILAYSLPIGWLFASLLWTKVAPGLSESFPSGSLLTGMVLAALFAFVLTSLPPLLFLGEAERYFEYGLAALVVLTAHLGWTAGWDMPANALILLTVNMIIVLIGLFISTRRQLKNAFTVADEPQFRELLIFLSSTQKRHIITLPTKFAFKLSTALEGNHLFYFDNVCVPGDGMRYMHEEHVRLHYFRPEPEYFYKRYGIDTMVLSRYFLQQATHYGLQYEQSLHGWTKTFENREYLVYMHEDSAIGEHNAR